MRTKDSSSTPARHSHWLLRLVRSCGFAPVTEVKALEKKLKRAESSRQWYAHRCDMLQREQKRFGEGNARTLLCDILANGQLLPDPKGERYPSPSPNSPVLASEERGS